VASLMNNKLRNAYFSFGKRGIDLFLAFIALLLLMPLLSIVYVLIRCSLGNPVFYRHKRPGKNGIKFIMYKFRTMTEDKDNNGNLVPDDKRLTRLGKILRSTSIDELPELWNVIKGDMSLVGPRPLLIEYLDCYTFEQARRHEVKPGITGWAQVNGRNAIEFEKRFKLDVWYVDNQSLWLDLKILLKTVKKILTRDGIFQKGQKLQVFKVTKVS
jgi:lipopolysaccharide/colanic/teichoic acid biosynthesis glycosyltransferase